MKPKWVLKWIETDAEIARDLWNAAQRAAALGAARPHSPSIVSGTPKAQSDVAAYSSSALQSAVGVSAHLPFFRRVTISSASDDHQRTYCVTDVRSVASIGTYADDGYTPLGWSSPMAARLPAVLGQPFEDVRQRGRYWKIVAQARYQGRLLPHPLKARVEAREGSYELAEDSNDGGDWPHEVGKPSSTPPLRDARHGRERGTHGGLVNIAASADEEQWRTFHHSLEGDVLVEGPPGSGKTSVALMRVPCLIDRQWEELGLRRDRDPPRFSEARTLVVIANEALLQTLESLMGDLQLHGLVPSTLESVIRAALVSSPRLQPRDFRAETEAEAALRQAGRFLPLLESGVYAVAQSVARDLRDHDSNGTMTVEAQRALRVRIETWASTIQQGTSSTFEQLLDQWVRDFTDQRQGNAPALRSAASKIGGGIFDRRKILNAVQEQLQSARVQDPALKRWMVAWRERESNASLGEWAAFGTIKCRLYSNGEQSAYGSAAESSLPPTHIVVDEAQDLGLSEFSFLRARLAKDGVMTLAGDPAQAERALSSGAGWSGIHASRFHRVNLGVNYRQSKEIGEFVRAVFASLYREEARWKAGSRRAGQPVRVVRLDGPLLPGRVVGEIVGVVRSYRELVPDAPMAVIHHGDGDLTEAIVSALQAQGFEGVQRAEDLAKYPMGEVVVGNAWALRGLEFSAAVVLDLTCSDAPEELHDEAVRNALYVSVSRACDLLTVVAHRGASGLLLLRAAEHSRSLGTV